MSNISDIEATAAALFDGGWRAKDRVEMMEEHDLTAKDADKIIEYFERWTVRNLQELTGQESGIVIYGSYGIVCNWSSMQGLPHIFATGLVDMEEDIPKVAGEYLTDLSNYLDGVEIDDYSSDNPDLPTSGTVYELLNVADDTVIIIAPDDWA